jgi:demethylmenaquinone methyltransferase/2-methoxy-6-polyprenyl-1,4-benzoquinol methylase
MIPRTVVTSHPTMDFPLPDSQSAKQDRMRALFDGIAHRYDFLNHFLSSGFDILWRKRLIELLRPFKPGLMLDVATGTADVAIEAARSLGTKVIGVDISSRMLDRGRSKVLSLALQQQIDLRHGEAESLEFESNTFDAVTVAFGVRNFANIPKGLSEMYRVLKPKGVVAVLEFSRPATFPFRNIYGFYFRRILPFVGGLVSSHRASYEYLPESVRQFPDGSEFLEIVESVGFSKGEAHPLTFGIATIYVYTKSV